MRNLLLNPFFYYAITFCFSLSLYQLGWSDLYPEIGMDLMGFFLISVILGFPFLISINNISTKCFRDLNHFKEKLRVSKKNIYGISFFSCFLIISEFIYNRGIPLVLILLGEKYNYTLFGIPVLHVFILPFLTVIGFTFFYRYIIFGERKYLIPVLFSFLFPVLIFNRAMVIFMLLGFLLIYISFRYSFVKIMKAALALLVILYLFGIAGNLRMKSSGFTEENAILKIGQASYSFEHSAIPSEFFWGYLYLSSPIANLQNEIDTYNRQPNSLDKFFIFEILPDFISKRVDSTDGVDDQANLLEENLNVSSMYGGAIHKMNLMGAYFLFFYYCFFVFCSILLCPRSMKLVMLAILSVISALLIFTNLLTSSGFFFQIVLLLLLSRIKFKGITLV